MCKKFLKTRKNLKKHSFKSKTKNKFLGVNILSIISLLFLLSTSVFYLWLINDHVILGYKMSKLEEKVNILKENNEKIELELVEVQEVDLIKQRAQAMELSVIDNVDYLSVNNNGLAVVR